MLLHEIHDTPAGIASQARPHSEARTRRLAVRPRKGSGFRCNILIFELQDSISLKRRKRCEVFCQSISLVS
ncbi:hypothetical protein CIB95_11510 [Lottiidibacillus patelloidae]|uniref:Uncharacterized protein n=1 Tax=Lottiidibacillus patelloidae TaxID=2670334 RepID=A0A263BRS2_9BACI|nr:hypothetical protein CIB95_11510 [Lottiidibacillus patelloidae]